MTMLRRILLCLIGGVLAAGLCAASDDMIAVSGSVRDGEGKPIAGAKLSLASDHAIAETSSAPATVLQATSDGEGHYRFDGVRAGKYQINVEMSGFANAVRAIEVSAASVSTAIDFTLTPPSSASGPSKPPLKFQAAGVRGLIDPGGYSAPADAAAASGLIKGMADIKRAGGYGAGVIDSRDWPCGIEPELKHAVAARPDRGESNRRLGEFYVAHDQAATALPFLKRAREIDHDDDIAARDLALAWMDLGHFDSARDLLAAQAEKLHTAAAYRLLARAEEGSGMFSQASQHYQLAANSDPSEENLFGVGYEFILAGSPADAERAFDAGLKKRPQSVRLLIGLGAAEFLQGHAEQGILSFLQASDLDPSDPRPYSFLASAAEASRSEAERVQAAFQRFLRLAPDNPEAPYFYAVILLRGGAASGAENSATVETLLKRAITLDPGMAKAHTELGTVYEHGGDYEKAAREYEETVQLAPGLKEAHYRLAGAYRHTGRMELAARETQLFQQARERESSQATDSTSDIAQFVSVFQGADHRSVDAVKCPDSAH